MSTETREDILVEEEIRRHRKVRRLIILGAAVFVLLLVLILALRAANRTYREAVIGWTSEMGGSTMAESVLFDGHVLRYSPGGLALLDDRGKQLWNEGYSMENPRVKIQGTYGAAADLGGTSAVVFDRKGITGTVTTTRPIRNLTVSGHGVLALVLDQGAATRIQFYDKTGSELDISVNLTMSVSGYPLSLALSPEGTTLAAAVVTSTSGALKTQIVFYNFSAGKSVSNRMVGYFEYTGVLFPELTFLNGSGMAAIGDDRILFFSLRNETKPELLRELEPDTRLNAVASGSGLLSLVLPAVGGGQSRVQVYGADGKLRFQKETAELCTRIVHSDDYILMGTETGIILWDHSGKERFSGPLTYSGQTVFPMSRNTLLQCEGSLICGYTLH